MPVISRANAVWSPSKKSEAPVVFIVRYQSWWSTTPAGWRTIVRRALIDNGLNQHGLNRLAKALPEPPKAARTGRDEAGRLVYDVGGVTVYHVTGWTIENWAGAAQILGLDSVGV